MVLEAGYANTTGFRKVVKATILVKKKPGMSDEDFIQHYNHKHAQMAAPVLEKHNCITYSLVRLLISQFKSSIHFSALVLPVEKSPAVQYIHLSPLLSK